MNLLTVFLLSAALQATASAPVVLEQVSLAVVNGNLEVTVIPAPTFIRIQVKDSAPIDPTRFTQGQTPEAQWGVAFFKLSELPPGEFDVIISAAPCERRIPVYGPNRTKLR